MLRVTGALFLVCALGSGLAPASAQSSVASVKQPSFDAATIKPPDPKAAYRVAGFIGKPGGRIFFGGTVQMLAQMAFNLRRYQVVGGADWTNKQWFEINAVPPDNSASRKITVGNREPSPEQRLMLQSLLRDRFGFRFHLESKEGEVYLLSRGHKALQLKPPKDPAADPRANVINKRGVIDGEAFGVNTTTGYLAQRLGYYLQLPVVDQTGITGSYDFHLPPVDPENRDNVAAVIGVVDRLGLTIKRGRGPIQTLVIDHVEQPSAN
ncbi:MAG TPA: TIGR03435 family protein [Acidobacteriaceae bacterium]|nr:TIGR03435 family protein [Acidobacteriaceae bacterium]